jgi:hypothetical protein
MNASNGTANGTAKARVTAASASTSAATANATANATATVTALLDEFGDTWETPEAVGAVRDRLVARIAGWSLPDSYGLARERDGRIEFARANFGDHPLPAVVLATVLGHGGGTAVYRMDAPLLTQAIRLLAPAEACTAYPHPNLWAWREVLEELEDGGAVIAVFDYAEGTGEVDPAVKALRDLELADPTDPADKVAPWR